MSYWAQRRAELEARLSKFNPYHKPAGTSDGGQFTTAQGAGKGGGGKALDFVPPKPMRPGKIRQFTFGVMDPYEVDPADEPLTSYSPKKVVRVESIDDALKLIAEGKDVELKSEADVATLLDKLKAMVDDAVEKGEQAPDYDLCRVSVAGTNLFCAQNKGVPRINMPQLGGKPVKGSKADKLPKDDKGEVNAGAAFEAHLGTIGVKVTRKTVQASSLKASQSQLVGAKVAGMVANKKFDPGRDAIFVSRDGYVIDGHHRWAAQVGRDTGDGKLGDLNMPVIEIDMPISAVLREANAWTAEFGIAPKAGGAQPSGNRAVDRDGDGRVLEGTDKERAATGDERVKKGCIGCGDSPFAKFNPYHDELGRFTTAEGNVTGGGGVPGGSAVDGQWQPGPPPKGYNERGQADWKSGLKVLADMPERFNTTIIGEDGLPTAEEPGVDYSWLNDSELTPDERAGASTVSRAMQNEWKREIQLAITMNKISPEEAFERWRYSSQPERGEWEELPGELYHATSALDAVMSSGLKTRSELEGTAGLGGGTDAAISFTSDRAVADAIVSGIHELRRVVRDDTGPEAVEWMRREAATWDWDPRHTYFEDTFGPQVRIEDAADRASLYQSFSSWREHHTGQLDPLFFNVDAEAFANLDPAQVGIVTVRPVKPGVKGWQASALGEWRVATGSAIEIIDGDNDGYVNDGSDEERYVGKHANHDQKSHGNWARGRTVAIDNPVGRISPNRDHGLFDDIEVDMDSLPPEVREDIVGTLASEGMTLDMIQRNYDDLFEAAIARGVDHVEETSDWYPNAHGLAKEWADEFGVSTEQMAAVIAATSQNQEWRQNQRIAHRLGRFLYEDTPLDLTKKQLRALHKAIAKRSPGTDLQSIGNGTRPSEVEDHMAVALMYGVMNSAHGWKSGGLYGPIAQGVAIMAGEDPERVLNGSKIRSFYNNIRDPHSSVDLTIDTHMFRAGFSGMANVGVTDRESLQVLSPGAVSKFNSQPKLTRRLPGHENDPKDIIGTTPATAARRNVGRIEVGTKPAFATAIRNISRRTGFTPNAVQALIWTEQKERLPQGLLNQVAQDRGWVKEGTKRGGVSFARTTPGFERRDGDGDGYVGEDEEAGVAGTYVGTS